ncbi:MAG: isochorismatase hydrolase [Verrucomicrobiales bacterium]|nr:isochorismatase hydrolase [Verrucomicrobiales bacterium]
MKSGIGKENELGESPVALLLIDVINDLEWPEGEKILKPALEMAENIGGLLARARATGVPVIYVNDNFGRWRSDFRRLVEHCLEPGIRGKPIVERLRPEPEDYFVLKPRHSGFYGSCLDILLRALRVRTLVLTGLAGNLCVLYTANDAYMRGYELIVPWDALASNSETENSQALEQMRTYLKAETPSSKELSFEKLFSGEGENKTEKDMPALSV